MRLQYLLLSLSFVFEVVKNEPHQQNIRKYFSSAAAGDRTFSKPFVESYWETWVLKDWPTDYCATLKDVPMTPMGSIEGVNIINIAFADYTGGLNGIECNTSVVSEGIHAIHQAGGLVKVAYGGALYSMSFGVHDEASADAFCDSVVKMRNEYQVDGIDLDVEDGGVGAELQIYLFDSCRKKLGSDFLITYTIPATIASVEPWTSALRDGISYLDYINVMAYDYYWPGYDFTLDLESLQALGVPKNKIVWGIMPGHSDAANEYTSLEDAENVARFVKEQGLPGVMTWDINRDCDKRMHFSAGVDNIYQTGLPPASYVNLLSRTLNN